MVAQAIRACELEDLSQPFVMKKKEDVDNNTKALKHDIMIMKETAIIYIACSIC